MLRSDLGRDCRVGGVARSRAFGAKRASGVSTLAMFRHSSANERYSMRQQTFSLIRVRDAAGAGRRPACCWPGRWRFRSCSAAPASGQQARRRRRHAARAVPSGAAVVAGRPPAAAADPAADPADHREPAWCEDPSDRRYNRPFQRSASEPGDRLRRDDQLYDLIIELDHNTRPRIAGRGSGVFMHVARPNRSPTAGCVALETRTLRQLLARLGSKTRIDIRFCAGDRRRCATSPHRRRSSVERPAYVRCPKIAVPTRTWVAPNAIAIAKSALMPIDRT